MGNSLSNVAGTVSFFSQMPLDVNDNKVTKTDIKENLDRSGKLPPDIQSRGVQKQTRVKASDKGSASPIKTITAQSSGVRQPYTHNHVNPFPAYVSRVGTLFLCCLRSEGVSKNSLASCKFNGGCSKV
eukprot:scaffold28065_cov68-Cyclotella_meneghiniana.AAC.1